MDKNKFLDIFFLMMGALLMLQFWPYLIIFLHLKIMIFHFHLQSLSGKTLSNSSISSFFFLSSYLYYMFSKKKCYLYIICNKILKLSQKKKIRYWNLDRSYCVCMYIAYVSILYVYIIFFIWNTLWFCFFFNF